MPFRTVPIWKKAPFIRVLIPFMAGIIIQWYLQCSLLFWQFTIVISLVILLVSFFFPFYHRFRLLFIAGISVTVLFAAIGALLEDCHDIRNKVNAFGKPGFDTGEIIATVEEEPVQRPNS